MIEDNDSDSLITQLKTALADKGIILPSDCSYKTVLRDILVAVSQRSASDATELNIAPVYMSSLGDQDMPISLEAAQALVATKAVNPSTTKAFTLEDFGFTQTKPATLDMSALQAQLADKDHKISQLADAVKILRNTAATRIKNEVQTRLNNLKTRGLSEAVIASLQPQVEFQMSLLADGTCAPHPLELTLSALETSLPEVPSKSDPLKGGYSLPNPYTSDNMMTESDMDKSIDDILASI
jgi:hypothetical protein